MRNLAAFISFFMFLSTTIPASGAPLAESEPNDEFDQAQIVEVGQTMTGTIYPGRDIDTYKFVVHAKRREVVMVIVNNNAHEIAPNLIIYNDNRESIGGITAPAGTKKVSYKVIANPDQEFYVRIFSNNCPGMEASDAVKHRDNAHSQKPYLLEVRLANNEKDGVLIDQYEPNDDFDHATPVGLDQEVTATIEPSRDMDVYKLKSHLTKRERLVAVFENHAENIAPCIVAYNTNREVIGGKAEPKGGFKTKFVFDASPNDEFYFRLFSNHSTTGDAEWDIKHRDDERSNKPYKFKVQVAQ